MSEKQRFGDGQDNYLQGMRQAAEAARQFGSAAGGAGAAGAAGSAAGEAAANAAAATVKAGVEAGKAVSGIAAGTAVGGPWGAVLSAAWSLRHTLFKILIFICLSLLFIIIAVVSLPSIVFNNIFHTDPSTVDPNGPTEVSANFDDLSAVVSDCIQAGYDAALARVDQIIADGGYDYELSMEALVNNALVSADYDTCYALAAYSASMGQRGTTKSDLQSKLNAVADQMYRVTYEVKEAQVPAESGEDTDEAGEGSDSESEEEPEMETVEYVVCTIHPFDQSVILDAFGVDVDATYDQFSISARSGDMTVEVNSTMTTRQSLALAQVIPQYRYTEGIGRRRVLTPDEVLRLPNDELLIILRGQKVLRAKKFDFTEHPYAKECERTSIQRYQTDPAPAQPPEPPAQSMPAEPDMGKPPGPAPAVAAKQPVKAKPPQAKPKAPVPKSPSSGGQPSELPAKPAKRPKTLYESSRPPADF